MTEMKEYKDFTCVDCPIMRRGRCTANPPPNTVTEAHWPRVKPEEDACWLGYSVHRSELFENPRRKNK